MPVDPQLIGPATLAMTQSLSLFQGFLPKFEDIRKHPYGASPGFETDVRMGEVAATILTLGIGTIATGLTGSKVPVLVSLVSAVGLIVLYESALHANSVKVITANV